MLHKLGSTLFLVSIIIYFLKYLKFINNRLRVKLHILTGALGALAMVIYSLSDYIKEGEATIIPVGIASLLIILSGTNKVRKRYKWLHLTSIMIFIFTLAYHIIK